MSTPKWITDRSFSDYLGIASIVFVFINFVCDVSRENNARLRALQLDTLQYRSSSTDHQPFLKVLGVPVIQDAWIGGRVYTRSTLVQPGNSSARSDTAVLRTLDTVTITFQVANTSAHHAVLILEGLADSNSFSPILRTELRRPSGDRYVEVHHQEKIEEIAPHDTVTLVHTTRVFSQAATKFTLHFHLVYENPLKQLFDSYFWIDATKKEAKVWREYRDSAGVHQTRLIRQPADIRALVTFSTPISDSYTAYSQADAEVIRAWLSGH